MSNLSESMLLWLPAYMVEDHEAVENVTKANELTLDFCNGEISLEETLDRLQSNQIDIDTYLANFDQSLHNFGA